MSENKNGIDKGLIRDLANILNETDLTEIEVEQEDVRIRVSRVSATQYVQAPMAAAPAAAVAAPAPVAAAVPAPRDNANAVNAPMVGTVYLSPAPGSRSFVEVGATVKEGQTLLIIEAMKTMNQIPAPRSGKVVEILVTDSQPVEYGEPLVIIE
ncbi:MAG: acetyl-CoA carboxylase biotin carboxyl carrier protein [Pseudorhizobium sp.]